MRAITVCIAASVLLCLISSPVSARQLRQDANAAAGNDTTAATSPSPPAANVVVVNGSAPATTGASTSTPPAGNTVVVVDNTTAGSNTTTGSSTTGGAMMANNYTAAYPTIFDAVSAANNTAAGNMSILMSAIKASGVASAITNDTAWTILAPNNDAFTKALAALNMTAEELLANKTLLTTILSYHVLPEAAINSSNLIPGASVATALPGANLTVDVTNMTDVTFMGDRNNASVLVPDIIAGKSTIHVIDTVLLPPANATMPMPGAAPAGNVTVIVLNGTTNATSPPPMEAATAASSPPPDTTGAAGNTGTASNADNTGAAGTTSADNTGAAGTTSADNTGAAGAAPTDTTGAAGNAGSSPSP